MQDNETPSHFLLSTKFWMNFCKKLNKRCNYVWTLLYDESGVCIGVQKLCSREDVKGFIKTYGGFAVGTNIGVIGIYTEKGIERPVDRMDLSGTKKQY